MLRLVARSMIIYLCPLDKKGGRICIDTTLVNGFTNIFACKHDEIMGCVKTDVRSICQFDFILIRIWSKQCVPKYSSDKVTQFKVREKVSGSAAYALVKFN